MARETKTIVAEVHGRENKDDLVLGGPTVVQRGGHFPEYIPSQHGGAHEIFSTACLVKGCTAMVYECEVRWPSDCPSTQLFDTAGGRKEPHRSTRHRHCQAGHHSCAHNGGSITCTSCASQPCRWHIHPSAWDRGVGKPGATPLGTSAIDIRGLDKMLLFHALWDNAHRYYPGPVTEWDPAIAQLALSNPYSGTLDHHQGRYLLTDVRPDLLWPFDYDRHAIQPARSVVAKLRALPK